MWGSKKSISATAKNICAYTCVGEMPIRLFFSHLTTTEKNIAVWLLVTRTIPISDNRIMPCREWEVPIQTGTFLLRLSNYASQNTKKFTSVITPRQ